MEPYWSDGTVSLYHGDCREVTEWLAADVLVTDPPYGRGWRSGCGLKNSNGYGYSRTHRGIANNDDLTARDEALAMWGSRLAVVFGDLLKPPPTGTVQALVYAKPADAGIRGARGGFRRDAEAIYLVGPWPAGVGGTSSIIRSNGSVAGPRGVGFRTGHPHAKPIDLMETLIGACPPGVIAEPFAGSGSTLLAARNLGRRAVGVEVDEQYCEIAARRLAQTALVAGGA